VSDSTGRALDEQESEDDAPYCLLSETRDWLMCDDCGQLQSIVAISPEHALECFNCGCTMHQGHGPWLQVAGALAATAMLLFIVSLFFPMLTLEIGSQSQTITILDGFYALMQRQNWMLAALILTTLVLFPLFQISVLLYLLIPYSMNRRLIGQAFFLRWLIQIKNWSMLEVFLLGLVVASVKMADMSTLHLEVGAFALFMLVAVLILAYIKLDTMKLWAWINPNNYFTHVLGEHVHDCTACNAMVGASVVEREKYCPRCGTEIHFRIPNSIQKTTAFTAAAAILYIPANILPIMTYSTLGGSGTDTIYSGVVALVSKGLWGVATIVFVASIVVPMLKLAILSYLIWAVKFKITVGVRHRAFLYRLTELIGRWSMVDVFVVTIFVAIVQFGFVYTVESEGAIIAFGAVVVFTMLAAETFDPRLLWDALEENKNG
jgi:paraquat-inducible protein A